MNSSQGSFDKPIGCSKRLRAFRPACIKFFFPRKKNFQLLRIMEFGGSKLIWMAEDSFPERFEMWLKSSFSEAQIRESRLLFIETKKKKKKEEEEGKTKMPQFVFSSVVMDSVFA